MTYKWGTWEEIDHKCQKIFAVYYANWKHLYNLKKTWNTEAEKIVFMIVPRRSSKLVGVTWETSPLQETLRVLFPWFKDRTNQVQFCFSDDHYLQVLTHFWSSKERRGITTYSRLVGWVLKRVSLLKEQFKKKDF